VPPPDNSPGTDDPFGGMDPMAWLESLAKRQGANLDELTTAADLDVPLPPEGAQDTSPGYTPYDTGSSKPAKAEPPKVEPKPEPIAAAPVAPVASADDPFGGMDPMAWLESLAKRQGANADELTTSADLDVPLPPEDAQVTGPGYTPGYDTGKKAEPEPAKPAANPFMSATPVKAEPPKAEPPKVEPAVASANPFMSAAPVKAEPPKVEAKPEPIAAAPVASTASADDPFGGMDPMAWLESLAKRQGANVDELTTSADLDVPLPPEDAQVTGPGYTPGYDTGKKAEPEPAKPVQAAAPQPPKAEPPKVEPQPEPIAAAPVAPVASTASADDPFGGMDPMAWLESLAKRQGANVDELTTSADLDVPLPPEDAQVTGPGYTPGYDTGKKAEPEAAKPAAKPEQPVTIKFDAPQPTPSVPAPKQPEQPAANLENLFAAPETVEPLGWPESVQSIESVSESAASTDDPFGGLDPMAWLEALAKRQGADPAELVTGGTADVPPPPTTAIPQGPGYSDYSPFGQQPLSGEMETPSMSQAEAEKLLGLTPGGQSVEANPLEEMDPIKWLESLAANEPTSAPTSEELTIFTASTETSDVMEAETALDWLEQLARETGDLPPAPAVEPADDWLANPPQQPEQIADPVFDNSAGLSNDPNEILQWLTSQTEGIQEESNAAVLETSAFDEPIPADLPDWLREQLGTLGMGENPLSEQIIEPPVPGELPDWLVASVESQPATGTLDFEKFLEPEPVAESIQPESEKFSTSEIEALVSPGEEVDPWAEALDEEYERKQAGDVTIPDWYQEALDRYGDAGIEAKPGPVGAEAVISPAEPPSWIGALTEEPAEAEPAIAEGIPAWLLEANPDFKAPPAQTEEKIPVDDWTSEAAALSADLPDWLRPAEPAKPAPVAPPPVQVTPPVPPPPVQQPAARAPQVDLAGSLRSARELVARGAHLDSLSHFEPLIDVSYELDSVIGELNKVVSAQPKSPRARRLLGDAYMRHGDLQKALDTYRSALDQL